MAHFIARTVTENPGYMQAKIRVPAGEELHAGQVVVAESLDATLGYGNWDVYAPTKVANAASDRVAIILDGGFETLNDGRRPEGQPDYTQYTFKAGEVVTAHRLMPEVRFEISKEALSEDAAEATIAVGDNLIPAASQWELDLSAASEAVTAKTYLKVEALKYFRLGGKAGAEFAETLVVRTKITD